MKGLTTLQSNSSSPLDARECVKGLNTGQSTTSSPHHARKCVKGLNTGQSTTSSPLHARKCVKGLTIGQSTTSSCQGMCERVNHWAEYYFLMQGNVWKGYPLGRVLLPHARECVKGLTTGQSTTSSPLHARKPMVKRFSTKRVKTPKCIQI